MPEAAAAPAKPLPLPTEGLGSWDFWKAEITNAEAKRDDTYGPLWTRNIRSYLAQPSTASGLGDVNTDQLVTPKDFANVEQKKAQLFFQLPKIIMKALQPQFEMAAPIAQAVLRFYLGPNRVDAVKMMAECLFDALCPAGIMACKVGYESITDGTSMITVMQSAPDVQPPAAPLGQASPIGAAAPGSILGLQQSPAMIPVPQMVPRIISERYFIERISPAKVLIPDGFQGSNYDLAPWNGMRFDGYADVIRRRYKLTEDDGKGTSEDEHRIKSETNPTAANGNKITGWEIWYKAAMFDPTEAHPEKLRLLVMLDGVDSPVVHKDSPYQVFDQTTGRLTRGMRGFPIQIGALRYVSDSAYPPSECTIGRALVENLSRFDTQSAVMRDRAVSFLLADLDRIGGPPALEKMRRGIFGSIIGVHGLDANNPPLVEASKPHLSSDHYQSRNQLDRDLSEVWAFGPNQRGQEASESRSATEMKLAQANASARLSAERRETMDFFVKSATKLFALLQLFADKEEFVEIVGDEGEKRYESWDKTKIAGEYAFEIKPDSAAQIDYVQERGDLLRAYELIRRDPNVNAIPLLERIATAFDFDPYGQAGLVVAKLPPRPPKPAEIAMSMKLEDLDLGDPLFEVKLSIMQQSGYVFPPEMIQKAQQHRQMQALTMAHSGINDPGLIPSGATQTPAQPSREHPGAAPKVERLNKHLERSTGGIPNAPGGQIQ